ncbi:MAG: DUF4838 domain-containing protein [Oscillospiraceae bacterium]
MNITSPVCLQVTNKFPATSPIVNFAIEQLTHYINEIFKEEINQTTVIIPVELSNKPTKPLRHDGYCVCIEDNAITLSSSEERGILYGVYELLKLIGCRFTYPQKSLHKIPHLKQFDLENQTIVKNPLIELRGLCLYNTTKETLNETLDMIDYMGKNGYNLILTSVNRLDDAVNQNHAILWNEIATEIESELIKRGIVIDMSEHSTDYFFSREKWYQLHPEWFSMIDGKRSPLQICYSNQDAIEEYSKSFVEYVKENHNFQIIGVWPLDGGGYCECEKCKDPLALLNANTYIANKINEVRPDLTVEFLAYTPQSFSRPKENLPKNMSALVCNVKDIVAYEWGIKAKNSGGAFYFDYHTGDNYRFRANLWINPFYCRDMVNTFSAYGYRGIVSLYLPITCWWQASLNYYYLSRCYYEPTADINDITLDLASDLFGESKANQMRDIMIKLFQQLQDQTLWSRMPHKHDYFAEHITDREKAVDEIHLQRFEQIYHKLLTMFSAVDTSTFSEFELQQFSLLQDYVKLQSIYFKTIDQYDAKTDTEQKVEPYFNALALLEEKYGQIFITEEYARWRIVGRDNICNPKNANEYQPKND